MTCQPILKDYSSPDVADLERWTTRTRSDVYILVELSIGPEGKDGSDLFSVQVCTPESLRKRERAESIVIEDRGLLVVKDYDWDAIASHIRGIIASSAAQDWSQSSLKLLRHFRWEYEDYHLPGS